MFAKQLMTRKDKKMAKKREDDYPSARNADMRVRSGWDDDLRCVELHGGRKTDRFEYRRQEKANWGCCVR